MHYVTAYCTCILPSLGYGSCRPAKDVELLVGQALEVHRRWVGDGLGFLQSLCRHSTFVRILARKTTHPDGSRAAVSALLLYRLIT
jgi:hypothetical protein